MTITIAHLSDIHLAPLPRFGTKALFSKRLFGYLNWWRGRDAIHRPEILGRLVDDINMFNPDHFVVTGDLTNLGLREEYEAVRLWLQTVAPVEKITVIPGNHDAYVPGALETGLEMLAPWMEPDHPQKDIFPFVHHCGNVALIGTSSAIATRPFSAAGRMGDMQLERISSVLQKLGAAHQFRILLVHHPLRVRRSKYSKRLKDGENLINVLKMQGAELVLYGHMHEAQRQDYEGPSSLCHTIGVPSASADPENSRRPAGYALYEIDETADVWRVTMKRREMKADLTFFTVETTVFTYPKPKAIPA